MAKKGSNGAKVAKMAINGVFCPLTFDLTIRFSETFQKGEDTYCTRIFGILTPRKIHICSLGALLGLKSLPLLGHFVELVHNLIFVQPVAVF